MSLNRPIHILLIDGHELARDGLQLLLNREPDLQVVGAFPDGEAAIAFLADAAAPVDVVLTELALPGLDGLAVIQRMRALPAPPRSLLLTLGLDGAALRDLITVGVDGCILKDATATELLAALRAVARGEAALSPRVARRLMAHAREEAGGTSLRGSATLTIREQEILALLARGLTSKEIARTLNRSVNTIDNHRARLLDKLDAPNTATAIRHGHDQGLLTADAA